jgi:hypothetical protein
MITASEIKKKIESYDLSKPHHAQFRLCVRGEKFADQHKLVFKGITEEIEATPQAFYDRARSYVRNHNEIAFALRKMHTGTAREHEEQAVAVLPALERIAKFHEAAPALRFYAFYLSERRTPYSALTKIGAVLKCFRSFGLIPDDVNNIRKLRNAAYHPGYSSDGFIVSNTGKKICTHTEVLELVGKIDELNRWVLMMTICLTIYNPKFTLLAISLLRYEYYNNFDLYADSLGPIYKFLGTSNQDLEPDPAASSPPKLAQWITMAYPFIKAPRKAFMGYVLVKGLTSKISSDFKKANSRTDVVRLFGAFQEKSLKVAQNLRMQAVAQSDKESQAALIQFAEAIDRDAERRLDLNRKTQQNMVDFMVRQLNKNS